MAARRMRTGLGRWAGALSVLVAAIAMATPMPTVSQPTGEPALDLRRVIDQQHLGQFWGAVAVRGRNGEIYAEGFGLRDAASLDPIEADDLFDAGSITKIVTALTVMDLVEDGVLSLDDTVREHVPVEMGDAAPVTLEQLLSHTSGLDDQHALQRLDFEDRDEAVRLAITGHRAFGPGENWRYSNAGFVVLAAVIEHATGNSYEEEARRRVLVPAGMEGSGFLDGLDAFGEPLDPERFTARVLPDRHGRGADHLGLLDDGYGWGLRGAGGLLTNARDLLRLDEAITANRMVEAETAVQMETLSSTYNGLGWFVGKTTWGGRLISHGGSTRGYAAEFRRYTDEGAAVVVMTNMNMHPGARGIADGIESAMFMDLRPRVSVEMRLGSLDLNEYKLATVDKPTLKVLRSEGGGVRIRAASDGIVVMETLLNRQAAERVMRGVRSLAESDNPPGEAGSTLVLAAYPYDLGEDGVVSLGPAGQTVDVEPQYRGRDIDGSTIVDDRTMVRVVDGPRRFWPVILKLGSDDAVGFVRELEEALDE